MTYIEKMQDVVTVWQNRYFEEGCRYKYTQEQFNNAFDEYLSILVFKNQFQHTLNDNEEIYRALQTGKPKSKK